MPRAAARDGGTDPAPRSDGPWRAALQLRFERTERRTEMVHAHHIGPLTVQKALYPEGPDPCHAIVLHPPGGVAAHDRLDLAITAALGAQVLITTPGASRWYRSGGDTANSVTRITVASGSVLEFLPRESIVFDGARLSAGIEVDLDGDARMIGWDCWCLGRIAAGESFDRGRVEVSMRLRRDGRLCWEERGAFDGGSRLLELAAGLAGQPVFGTLWAAGRDVPEALFERGRRLPFSGAGRAALTRLPGMVLARYLGPSTEEAHAWFTALWAILRPGWLGREAVVPRIWST